MTIPRRAPSVHALLFAILAITAAATWLVPAGDYTRLRYDRAGAAFVLHDGDAESRRPATQATLDELGVRTAPGCDSSAPCWPSWRSCAA